MVKFWASVSTLLQETALGPVVVQPVELVGLVTWKAKATAARERKEAKEAARMTIRWRITVTGGSKSSCLRL